MPFSFLQRDPQNAITLSDREHIFYTVAKRSHPVPAPRISLLGPDHPLDPVGLGALDLPHEIPDPESNLRRDFFRGVNLQVPPCVDLALCALYGLGAVLEGEVLLLAQAVGGGDQPAGGDQGGGASQAGFLFCFLFCLKKYLTVLNNASIFQIISVSRAVPFLQLVSFC